MSADETTTLHTWTAPAVGLATALAWAGHVRVAGTPLPALLQAPDWCVFAVLGEDGRLTGPDLDRDGRRAEEAFDVRLFSARGEVRWRRNWAPDGLGRAALLADAAPPGPPDGAAVREEGVHALPQTYLLWGQGDEALSARRRAGGAWAGWSWLTGGRHPALAVPLAGVADHARVCLGAREYLAAGAGGNTVVLDERLTTLTLEPDHG